MTELLQDIAATKENSDFIRVGLWGKKYVDVTVNLPKINLGETNNKAQIENKVGGMYHISNVVRFVLNTEAHTYRQRPGGIKSLNPCVPPLLKSTSHWVSEIEHA